jgi:hypothetical protein
MSVRSRVAHAIASMVTCVSVGCVEMESAPLGSTDLGATTPSAAGTPPTVSNPDPEGPKQGFLSFAGSVGAEGDSVVDGVAVRDLRGGSVVGASGAAWLANPTGWGEGVDVLPGDEHVVGGGVIAGAWWAVVVADGQAALADDAGVSVGPLAADVVTAAIGDDQLVAVRAPAGGACVVSWITLGGPTSDVAVPEQVCGALGVAVGGGATWVATGDGLWRVDAYGAVEVGVPATAVAFDPTCGWAYAGDDQGFVTRVDPEGGVAWRVDVGAPVRGLANLGGQRAAIVVTASDDGDAALLAVDGEDGALLAEDGLVGLGDGVVVSFDGTMLAHVWSPFVTWYAVGAVR